MIGTGIFSTPSTILSGTGSIGFSLIWWALGFVTSITAFSVYLEFTAYFPSLLGCGFYYWVWIYGLPGLRGYEIRQELVILDDGSQSHQLVKVPVAEVEEWDKTHDSAGRAVTLVTGSSTPNKIRGGSSVDGGDDDAGVKT